MGKILHFVFVFLICSASHAQFTEGFEGGTFPPTGWTSYRGTNNAGVTYDWELSSTVSNTGNNSAFVRYENSGSVNEDWLVTNLIDLTTVVNSELRFYARQDVLTDYGSIYSIRVSLTSQTTNFTIVKSWTETQLTAASDTFEEKTVNLSAYDGESVYIAFVLENDTGDSWWIDDISLAGATGCEAPTTPVVSAITDTTAGLSWGDVTTASLGYEWVIMNSGDDPDTETPIDLGTTISGVISDNTTNLLPSISYDFYVKANCDISGFSDWSSVFTFITHPSNDNLCDALTLTMDNSSFNGAYTNIGASRETQEPDGMCWDNLSNNTVWFKFVAPATGKVNITTNFNSGSLLDTQIALYSIGDCNDMSSLTELFCNEDIDFNNNNFLSEIEAIGLTSGFTYYIQVDGYFNDVGTFDLGITENTLEVEGLVDDIKLSIYPNPFINSLSIRLPNSLLNSAFQINIYDLNGRQVLAATETTNNGLISLNNLDKLASGMYVMQIINEKLYLNKTKQLIKK